MTTSTGADRARTPSPDRERGGDDRGLRRRSVWLLDQQRPPQRSGLRRRQLGEHGIEARPQQVGEAREREPQVALGGHRLQHRERALAGQAAPALSNVVLPAASRPGQHHAPVRAARRRRSADRLQFGVTAEDLCGHGPSVRPWAGPVSAEASGAVRCIGAAPPSLRTLLGGRVARPRSAAGSCEGPKECGFPRSRRRAAGAPLDRVLPEPAKTAPALTGAGTAVARSQSTGSQRSDRHPGPGPLRPSRAKGVLR